MTDKNYSDFLDIKVSEEAAKAFIGKGRFVKEKSHVAQDILERMMESKECYEIYLETHVQNSSELERMLKSRVSSLKFDFDCNMVLEGNDGGVVTGDLKNLDFSHGGKIICAKTADSILCFEMENQG